MNIVVDIFLVFFKIGLLSFGGVFGLLPEMERVIVHEYGWLSSEAFYQTFVIAQFAPGPNMAMCPLIGYRVAGIGGFIAGLLGIYSVPLVSMSLVAAMYERYKDIPVVRRTELMLRPLIVGLIGASALRFWGHQVSDNGAPLLPVVLSVMLVGTSLVLLSRKIIGGLPLILMSGIFWWVARMIG